MHAHIATLWTEALRSGEYIQGRNALCQKDAEGNLVYCCLGVLCDLHAKETGNAWTVSTMSPNLRRYDGVIAALPNCVVKWAGIKTLGSPMIGERCAILLNDDDRLSFAQLADLIDANADTI